MPPKKPAVRAATGTVAPQVDFVEPSPERLSAGDPEGLVAGDYREGELFEGADLSDYDLAGCSFLECRFDAVTLTEAELRGSRFIESVFVSTFAQSLKAARTTWRDIRFENPRWGSAEFFDSELESVHLRGGKIDYLNLRGARVTNVIVENCMIGDLDLGGFSGDRVAFVNCRIQTLDVTRARCLNVDLRSSEFAAIHGIAGLAGATIDDAQLSLLAPLLAEHLGLRVES